MLFLGDKKEISSHVKAGSFHVKKGVIVFFLRYTKYIKLFTYSEEGGSILFNFLSLVILVCSWTAAWNALHINSKLSKGLHEWLKFSLGF
jgi:hypothetical protein